MSTSIASISSQIASNIFSKIDTKNQGYLEKTDFTSSLGNSDSSNSDDAFKALDSDSDGKVTKSELSKGIENLLTQLGNATSQGMGMHGAGDKDGMPPPPPDGKGPPPNDAGLDKSQMSEMAKSDDSKLSSLATKISNNFDAADTNKDGKVSFQEAMSYDQSTQSSSSTSSTNNQSNAEETDLSTMMKKIGQLVEAYGLGNSTSSSGISVAA